MQIFTPEEELIFTEIWLLENRDNLYGEAKEQLDDDGYINYKIWEDVNWQRMYKEYLPLTRIIRGTNPNIIFHGGCLGCKSQRIYGIDKCKECIYFKFDHSKKNLYIEGEDSDKMTGEDLANLLK